MIAVAWIFQQHARVRIAWERPAQHLENVLRAIAIEIRKRDCVPFLELAETARCRNIQKAAPAVVAKHAIGQQRFVFGRAGAEIAIQPAVVIEVAKARPHGQNHAIQPHGLAHVREGSVPVVAIQTRGLGFVRQTQMERRNVSGRSGVIAGHQQVQPPVVVVVEKPGGKAVDGLANSGGAGHVCELPAPRFAWAVISKQQIRRAFARDVEIRAAVVVVVAPGHAFNEAHIGQPNLRGDVCERAVAIVMVQRRWMRVFFSGFAAHEKIQPAITVEVGPRRGLRGVERQQPGAFCDIGKGDLSARVRAVVAQQRHGILAVRAPPASAQHQNIGMAVVIEIGMDHVEAAGDAVQPRRVRLIAERAVAVVV